MKLNKNHINPIIYSLLYLSLIIGFILNEDFAEGYVKDFEIHQMLIKNLFDQGIIYGLINYDLYYVPHSPVYIIYIFLLKKILISYDLVRLVNLHICLIIPIILILSIKEKFKLKKSSDPLYLLPSLFLISPYFRSGSIWIDDNIFALIFFCAATFYFIKFENNKKTETFIFLSIFFLALSAYMRPIYSLFGMYFFIRFFLNNKNKGLLIKYILISIILSLPAFYYFFILDINKWAFTYIYRENIITIIFLVASVVTFYLIPFIFLTKKSLFKDFINLKYFLIFVLCLILNMAFFNYDRSYSGGIVIKFSTLFFNSNYFFYLVSSLCFIFILNTFFNDKIKKNFLDILIILILFFLEIDGVIYHETYDPLLYIIIIILFKNRLFVEFIEKYNIKKYFLIFSYFFIFFIAAILKSNYL